MGIFKMEIACYLFTPYVTENPSTTIHLAVFHSCIEQEFTVDMIRIIMGQNYVYFRIPCLWSKS